MDLIQIDQHREYRINNCIYRNEGCSEVYDVFDTKMNRNSILKRVWYRDEKEYEWLKREVTNQIVASVNSDFVPALYNFYRQKDYVWIEMEKKQGRSLRNVMDSWEGSIKPELRVDESVKIFKWLCCTMAQLHAEKSFVHKDLKPENIIINKGRECAYVIDFGTSGPWNIKGMGTPKYMAPEQRREFRGAHVTQATDVFSMGLIFFEMITGKIPTFGRDMIYDPIKKGWHNPIEVEGPVGTIYPTAVEVIKKCLQADYEKRYLNACVLRRDLWGMKKQKH
jgi:serine/threonine-protein kinase